MPAFDTPEPISATISIGTGSVRINAGDRGDTLVEVRPSDAFNEADVRAAEQTKVDFSQGHLLVKAAKGRTISLFGWGGSVEVTIDLPAGSRVEAEGAADIHAQGRLGESTFKTGSGDIWLDRTGRLRADSANGDITVAATHGPADIVAANGAVRVGRIDGTAVVKSANGDITVGEVTGDSRLSTAYGDISVGLALASVDARTSTGGIRVGEAVRGSITLETGYGDLEVGIRPGSAAWLDVSAPYGGVRTSLAAADGPLPSDETVEVRAGTSYGEIFIHRA
ncbi:hypothetical protein C1I98_07120 [Spongiactinospora gelatinilytica]|uniref:DUF4097 domain-containing protein n=1 Tax=Spongiactinospora gelatinilytica TaxID=2666298 RepID=A0A2W2GRQ9_9ACTN|nr:DUF4097 family beta strand repeat-containing protein [Spongiactinospora gelatinilytica]PZG52256.1 hypothetical protein C1I98_07120 [Spongiactinospora gelatinilytica]